MKKVLITGGAGFLGHHLTQYLLDKTDWEIVVADRLLSSSLGIRRLSECEFQNNKRINILKWDFSKKNNARIYKPLLDLDFIFHLGAETDVDKSIKKPSAFLRSNVIGTFNILELAKMQRKGFKQFIYVSTNEVFGSAKQGQNFSEWQPYNSQNPYSATKASGEELALSYASSYGVPVLIARTMNLFGERQNPRKFIPTVVRGLLKNKTIPIYSDSKGSMPGRRQYLYSKDFCSGLHFIVSDKNRPSFSGKLDLERDKINIAGKEEITNLELVEKIGRLVGKDPTWEFVDFHTSHSGHSLFFGLDTKKLDSIGWKPKKSFEQRLEETVSWLLKNQNTWL